MWCYVTTFHAVHRLIEQPRLDTVEVECRHTPNSWGATPDAVGFSRRISKDFQERKGGKGDFDLPRRDLLIDVLLQRLCPAERNIGELELVVVLDLKYRGKDVGFKIGLVIKLIC